MRRNFRQSHQRLLPSLRWLQLSGMDKETPIAMRGFLAS
jgi:hypothetical protein